MIDHKRIIGTISVQQTFAERIGRIEQIGPNRRLTFVTCSHDESGYYEAAVIVVISAEALTELAQAAAADRAVLPEFESLSTTQLAN